MARREAPTTVAKLGFAIAATALTVFLALGFSGQTVVNGESSGRTIGCGSVLSPEVQPLCDDLLASRKTLMLVVGIPGVALGLGIVIAGSWRADRRNK